MNKMYSRNLTFTFQKVICTYVVPTFLSSQKLILDKCISICNRMKTMHTVEVCHLYLFILLHPYGTTPNLMLEILKKCGSQWGNFYAALATCVASHSQTHLLQFIPEIDRYYIGVRGQPHMRCQACMSLKYLAYLTQRTLH